MFRRLMDLFFKKEVKVRMEFHDNLIYLKALMNGQEVLKMTCMKMQNGSLQISDIFSMQGEKNYNKGYGSMLMSEILNYAQKNCIHRVTGYLSMVDLGHKERLHAFYGKHGFEIIEYDEVVGTYYGEILKRL